MDKAALRELAEKARDYDSDRAMDNFDNAFGPEELISLLDENQSLTEERTAWRTTAENAEAELKAIKEVEPVAWFKHGPYEGDEPLSCVFEDQKDDVCFTPLYTLEGKS